ncbi:hypothetical protein WJX77_001960 [Trebouxia sp. C0004]
MAFTDYAQGGDAEDWYTFDVGLLEIVELEILVLHFDRIVDPCEDFHHIQGGWIRGIHDPCILAAQTPQAIIPNTRTRRVFNSSNIDDRLSSLRTCITGNASSDQHYIATLNKWAASYSNLANAIDTLPVSW